MSESDKRPGNVRQGAYRGPVQFTIWLAFGIAAFFVMRQVTPYLVIFMLNPKVSSACSTGAAIYGLHTHIAALESALKIRDESKRLQRDPAGYDQWSTPLGNYWIPKLTASALWIILGEQQRDIYDEGPVTVRPGDIVLDCGANVGVFTRTALRRGAKTVVAIEPAPENLECLRRNLQEEVRSGRVVVYPKGVWNKGASLPMHVNRNSAGDSFVLDPDPGHGSLALPLTTLDAIVSELHLPRVDFIKMDIEGAEVPAIEGAKLTIRSYRPRMSVASEHLPNDAETIPSAVLAIDPRYRVRCGACYVEDGFTRPEVLHFF